MSALSDRISSAFDPNNPTVKDRVAMMREGQRMVTARPLVGVGPNMVKERYAEFRDPGAVEQVNPHLHNVPLQIAAERGLSSQVEQVRRELHDRFAAITAESARRAD